MNLAKVFPFRQPSAQGAPRLRLVCFPFAGGTAALYRRWRDALPATVEVCAVELPGRGLRIGEPPTAITVAPALVVAATIVDGSSGSGDAPVS